MKKPVLLIVLDGWGHRLESRDNAIASAKKPNFDRLWSEYPHCLLKASGNAVGLPEGQMGNSEVGHMTIGAGKPIDTDLVRIDKEIENGNLAKNSVLAKVFSHVKNSKGTLHVMGLVSDGGVHSHDRHLRAILNIAKQNNVQKIAVHVFTDGRDTPPQSAGKYVAELEQEIESLGADYKIASVSGRYYAMDRDNNWDRLQKVLDVMFSASGKRYEGKTSDYLSKQYELGEKDELLMPAVRTENGVPVATIQDNDAIFFFNFRADRARMLSHKILDLPKNKNIYFATMTEYSVDFDCPVAYPPIKVETTLGSEIEGAGLRQARIAETEKFAHATYFLNCGREKPYNNETDILLDSRKDVKTHDEAPEMRAEDIARKAIQEIEAGTDFIFINFANADMVGHTANVPSIIKAVETVDTALGSVIDRLTALGGVAIITADHGNAEINIDPLTGLKHTAHTTSPVPCIITDKSLVIHDGGLADLAPTVLKLFGRKTPKNMSGNPLF